MKKNPKNLAPSFKDLEKLKELRFRNKFFKNHANVLELFLKTARANEEKIAIEFDGLKISYAKLLADISILRLPNLEKNSIVAIVKANKYKEIVALLALLFASYIPIIVTKKMPKKQKEYLKNLVAYNFNPNKQEDEGSIQASTLEYDSNNDFGSLFFSSNSTKKSPKLILTSQRTIVHFCLWQASCVVKTENRFAQLSPTTSDIYLRELFTCFLSASCLVLPSKEEKKDILTFLELKKITILNTVPSLLSSYLDKLRKRQVNSYLRFVFFSGERFSSELAKTCEHFCIKDVKIFNLYGLSEIGLAKIFYMYKTDFKGTYLPLTKSLSKSEYFVEKNRILIKTLFGTYGYINEQNKDFLWRDNGYLIYKTRDLASVSKGSKNLFINSKLENQKKISGKKINLEFYEDTLKLALNTKIFALIFHKKKLRVFTDFKNNEVLLKTLSKHLPKNTQGAIFKIKRLSLNPQGKLDRKALANIPKDLKKNIKKNAVKKAKFKNIIIDILKTKNFKLDDDFLSLIKNPSSCSLLANALSKAYKKDITIEHIAKYSSLRDLKNSLKNRPFKKDLPVKGLNPNSLN